MFDHVQIKVEDLGRSLAFYEPVLSTLYYAAFVIDPNGHNLEAVFKHP